jgi:hypothetical protein
MHKFGHYTCHLEAVIYHLQDAFLFASSAFLNTLHRLSPHTTNTWERFRQKWTT